MAPKSDFVPKSTLGILPPKSRHLGHKLTTNLWLEEKKETDGAEGLWRVHNDLYDLSEFIQKHPGGSEWLQLTKGHDITEAFEVHHLTDQPEEILRKYFVRKAKGPRNAPFSFDENGFYRTLKKEVKPLLKTLPKQSMNTTNFFSDSLVVLTFLFSTLAVRYWSFGLGILGGILLSMLTIAAHNYFHRRDNFRMHYFQFSFFTVRDWRISHVLSHHLHTNTIDDLEISAYEPFLQYLPTDKNKIQTYGSMLLAPFMWMSLFHFTLNKRIQDAIKYNFKNMKITDLITLTLPTFMWIFGGQSLLATFGMYNFVMVMASLHFGFVGLHAAHHHPDIFHDGDTPRATTNYDWGLSQLDAVMDRKEISGNHFLVLTNFGDHALHHLFPTLDHGALEHLYPTFEEVLGRFNENLRIVSQWDTIKGGYQQLKRVEPNPSPPELKKYAKRG
ncbi:unnamed protein product [Phaedon cochleariae]|uniref:Cytochrome b5-related protein n=1 Tax=Phaedon cochleariae TaxID=80249 RepID=A0A9P0GLU3_PHACE|nr:unnamed protein product [Phaedon cochleariae]